MCQEQICPWNVTYVPHAQITRHAFKGGSMPIYIYQIRSHCDQNCDLYEVTQTDRWTVYDCIS